MGFEFEFGHEILDLFVLSYASFVPIQKQIYEIPLNYIMGKFIATKFPDHQHRVVKKRPGKSIRRCTSGKPPQSKKSRKGSLPAKTEIPKKLEEVEDPNLEYQDLRTEVGTNPHSGRHYLKLVQPISDLFADDEVKAR